MDLFDTSSSGGSTGSNGKASPDANEPNYSLDTSASMLGSPTSQPRTLTSLDDSEILSQSLPKWLPSPIFSVTTAAKNEEEAREEADLQHRTAVISLLEDDAFVLDRAISEMEDVRPRDTPIPRTTRNPCNETQKRPHTQVDENHDPNVVEVIDCDQEEEYDWQLEDVEEEEEEEEEKYEYEWQLEDVDEYEGVDEDGDDVEFPPPSNRPKYCGHDGEEAEPTPCFAERIDLTEPIEKTDKFLEAARSLQLHIGRQYQPKQLLDKEADGSVVIGRTKEYQHLYDRLSALVDADLGGAVFVVGSPGTGKTMTACAIVGQYQRDTGHKRATVYINCVTTVRTAGMLFRELCMQLGVKVPVPRQPKGSRRRRKAPSVPPTVFLAALTKRLSDKTLPKVVIILDETDALFSPQFEAVLYSLYDLTLIPDAKLVIFFLANARAIPRTIQKKIRSRMTCPIINFRAYSMKELEKIVIHRADIWQKSPEAIASGVPWRQIISEDQIKLLASRLGSISGDARQLVAMSRMVIEEAADDYQDTVLGTDRIRAQPLVQEKHIKLVIQDLVTSDPVAIGISTLEDRPAVLLAIINKKSVQGAKDKQFGLGYIVSEAKEVPGLRNRLKGDYKSWITDILNLETVGLIKIPNQRKVTAPYLWQLRLAVDSMVVEENLTQEIVQSIIHNFS